jgi:hypothetical protein
MVGKIMRWRESYFAFASKLRSEISRGDIKMSEQFKIEGVRRFPQDDNKHDPMVTCFNTSSGMVMDYCLTLIGKDRTAIGCSINNQIEDYIYEAIYDNVTKQWMIVNQGRLGAAIWKWKRGVLFSIEEYVFNRLMNPHGFKATFYECITYERVCELLKTNNLPGIIAGNFSSLSPVGGHMNCLIGYNSVGVYEFITHDPFGNAYKQYKDKNGENMHYAARLFQTSPGKNSVNVIITSRI